MILENTHCSSSNMRSMHCVEMHALVLVGRIILSWSKLTMGIMMSFWHCHISLKSNFNLELWRPNVFSMIIEYFMNAISIIFLIGRWILFAFLPLPTLVEMCKLVACPSFPYIKLMVKDESESMLNSLYECRYCNSNR